MNAASMRATIEIFDKKVDGILDSNTYSYVFYSIKSNFPRKYINFEGDEQNVLPKAFPMIHLIDLILKGVRGNGLKEI